MQEQSVSYAAEKAGGILLRPALRDYGGQVAHSIRHHSSSAEFSISTSEDDTFIFYLTESIFFHGDVIRDIGEKGEETERIRSSAHSWRCQSLREKSVPSLGFIVPYGNGQGLFRSDHDDQFLSSGDSRIDQVSL